MSLTLALPRCEKIVGRCEFSNLNANLLSSLDRFHFTPFICIFATSVSDLISYRRFSFAECPWRRSSVYPVWGGGFRSLLVHGTSARNGEWVNCPLRSERAEEFLLLLVVHLLSTQIFAGRLLEPAQSALVVRIFVCWAIGLLRWACFFLAFNALTGWANHDHVFWATGRVHCAPRVPPAAVNIFHSLYLLYLPGVVFMFASTRR